jgi:hypothetical protein
MNLNNLDVTTTNNEIFTGEDSARMAVYIYRRFGEDVFAACAAWCRLMQNNTSPNHFAELVQKGFDLLNEDSYQVARLGL